MSGHSLIKFLIVCFSQSTIISDGAYFSTNQESRFASIEGQCPSKSEVLVATHEARLRALESKVLFCKLHFKLVHADFFLQKVMVRRSI